MTITERTCRVCAGILDPFLDFGVLALSDFPKPDEKPKGYAPLVCCTCRTCGLVQLKHTVDPDIMFRKEYWYRSSINELMRAELEDVVVKACARVPSWSHGEPVVDIGANDGTLLHAVQRRYPHAIRVGFEPAENLQDLLAPHCHVLINDYFPNQIPGGLKGRVKVLTSIAMFYDLDNPCAFVQAVDDVLAPDGVWVVQFQDLHQQLQATAFDNFVWEHLLYLSLAAVERILVAAGVDLHVVDVEQRAINGGSLRLTIQRTSVPQADAVEAMRRVEQGCESWDTLHRFGWRVGELIKQINALVDHLIHQERLVDLYGASTKGNVLTQVCGLGPSRIRQAWERSDFKWGLTTSTGIPIVSEEEGRADPPGAMVVGIWQHRVGILTREAAFLDGGGSLIFPMPVCEVVSAQ